MIPALLGAPNSAAVRIPKFAARSRSQTVFKFRASKVPEDNISAREPGQRNSGSLNRTDKSGMERRNSSVAYMYRRQMRVPHDLTGLIIGKSGSNIRRYQLMPGISSVKLLSDGTLVIVGVSKEAVASVERAVSLLISRCQGYVSQFQVFCFCRSLQNELLQAGNLSFETMFEENGAAFVCLKDAHEANPNDDVTVSLAAQFAQRLETTTTDTTFVPHWHFSGYRQALLKCLQKLDLADSQVKLIVRFGKQMVHGACCSELLRNGSSVDGLADLRRRRLLSTRFNLGCCEEAVDALRSRLQTQLGFVMVSQQQKISIRALHQSQNVNVSLRFVDAQGKQIGGDGVEQQEEAFRILRARDYLEVLGIKEGASEDEIKEGYRKCLVRLHFRPSDWKLIEKAQKLVTAAYNSLMRGGGAGFGCSAGGVASGSDSGLGSGEARQHHNVVVTRVRKNSARHGFVIFTRPGGSSITDFRLGVSSHHDDNNSEYPTHHFSKWVESAWNNRTSDNKLVFQVDNAMGSTSSSRIRTANADPEPEPEPVAFNVRYKQTETYATEDFKLRIGCVEVQDYHGWNDQEEKRVECSLSSRSFKWDTNMLCSSKKEDLLEKELVRLVKQASIISQAMQF